MPLSAALAIAGCVHADSRGLAATPPGTDARQADCREVSPPFSPFELAVVGSGGPRGFGRAASSYVVFVDGAPRILVDVGPGAFVRLGQMNLDFGALDTVLLTHLHVDHAGDLPGFVKSRDLSYNRPLTFRIFGPEGAGDYPSTTAFIDRLFGAKGAFAYLRNFRNDLGFAVTDLPVQASAPIREVLREGDLHITSIAVQHGDAPALAFRIEHAGHAVVFSGDLASKNDNLTRLAIGADLLVYDTSVLDPPNDPPVLYDLHTAPRRIGEVATAAQVRSLVLSHLTPDVEHAPDDVLASVRSTFKGQVRFAADCLRIDLTQAPAT